MVRRHVQNIVKKLVGVTLERICYGDEGIEFWCLEAALDIADILGRQIDHLCKFRLGESTDLPHFLNPSARFLTVHTIPPYKQ